MTGLPPSRYDLLVVGAGPGGYSAAFRAADLGLSVALVERHATLGGVCLNVGCIPSKALLHKAGVMREARALAATGIAFAEPSIDLARLRSYRHGVVGRLTEGLAAMAAARKVTVVRGEARLLGPGRAEVRDGEGGTRELAFAKAIVATGSRSVRLPCAPDDPRVLDSTSALALEDIPKRLLVIGGGIIGLEMATVYAALGSRVDVVEATDELMPGADRDLVKVWHALNAPMLGEVRTGTRVTAVEPGRKGLAVTLEGTDGVHRPEPYDRALVAIGRRPHTAGLGLETFGVVPDARGFVAVDSQMRTGHPDLFAIGDVVGQPMLAHKAVHQGHIAAEAAAGRPSHFDARVIPSVAYTDPEIAWVGLTESEARASGREVTRAVFPWAASGRAIASHAEQGLTRLLFDAQSGRCVGGGIVGAHAGDLIGEVCLAIEMGADAADIGRTIHPHPTFCESVGMAAEAAEGHCTDLMPQAARRKAGVH